MLGSDHTPSVWEEVEFGEWSQGGQCTILQISQLVDRSLRLMHMFVSPLVGTEAK